MSDDAGGPTELRVGSLCYCPENATMSGPRGHIRLTAQTSRVAERLFRRPGVTVDPGTLTGAMYQRPEEASAEACDVLRQRIKRVWSAMELLGVGDARLRFDPRLGYVVEAVKR